MAMVVVLIAMEYIDIYIHMKGTICSHVTLDKPNRTENQKNTEKREKYNEKRRQYTDP